MTICIYEDTSFRNFFPLTLLRPVYLLRAGILPLYKKIAGNFSSSGYVSLIARDQLAPLVSEKVSEFPVNIIKRNDGEDVLFVNGRLRTAGNLPTLVEQAQISTTYVNAGEVVAVLFKEELLKSFPSIATQKEFQELYESFLRNSQAPVSETTATLYHYSWDLIADIEPAIETDVELLKPTLTGSEQVTIHPGAFLVNETHIILRNNVEIFPGAVIDASHGPVYIEDNARIEPHAAVIGPCYIGADSIVLAGKITGSSIGSTCRVGGEVEESVFHAFVNKYHAGFIGHSYVAPWVNFGAMTTNSDLKNNYSSIRLTLNGTSIDSGSIKVGSFIGDHTKFGIGTLLNTGINIGVCCNIFGGTLITDKEVPSFSWGNSSGYVKYDFDKAIDTAQKVAQRRNQRISDREVGMLQAISNDTLVAQGVMEFELS